MNPTCNACRHAAAGRPRSSRRHGLTVTELVVSATLLVSAIGTVMPLAVSARRIQQDTRRYYLALDELSNQLDRLGSLAQEERKHALADLEPSPEIVELLEGATLQGEIVQDDDGSRLVLTLDWNRPMAAAPLQLVRWLDAMPAESADASSARSPQETEK